MQIKWFKDRDGSLWFHDFENECIYSIFDTHLKDKGLFVGVYCHVKIDKKSGTFTYKKPLFYDGFTLPQAKKLVENMIEVKSEKINSVKRIKRSNKKRTNSRRIA